MTKESISQVISWVFLSQDLTPTFHKKGGSQEKSQSTA
jgi:hypothetical protein